jgi:hypothetical protein
MPSVDSLRQASSADREDLRPLAHLLDTLTRTSAFPSSHEFMSRTALQSAACFNEPVHRFTAAEQRADT